MKSLDDLSCDKEASHPPTCALPSMSQEVYSFEYDHNLIELRLMLVGPKHFCGRIVYWHNQYWCQIVWPAGGVMQL